MSASVARATGSALAIRWPRHRSSPQGYSSASKRVRLVCWRATSSRSTGPRPRERARGPARSPHAATGSRPSAPPCAQGSHRALQGHRHNPTGARTCLMSGRRHPASECLLHHRAGRSPGPSTPTNASTRNLNPEVAAPPLHEWTSRGPARRQIRASVPAFNAVGRRRRSAEVRAMGAAGAVATGSALAPRWPRQRCCGVARRRQGRLRSGHPPRW